VKTWAAILGDSYTFDLIVDKIAGRKSAAQVEHRIAKSVVSSAATLTNSGSQNYNHQGIKEILAKEEDHLYPRPLAAYVGESQDKGWVPVCPAPNKPPRAWITGGSNVLRRSNMPQRFLEHVWPKLDLVVDINQKNTFTGLHADYLLPAAGYYEKPGIKYAVAYIPYLQYCGAAVKPVGESKDEWEIFYLLALEVQRIAKKRRTRALSGCGGKAVDLRTIGDRFTSGGKHGPHDAGKVTDSIIRKSSSTKGVKLKTLKKNGIAKFENSGGTGIQENIYNSDWDGEGILQALTDFVRHKASYMTLTGRQQYYIDHPWFLEAGEALPTHIDSPRAGGDHPFQMVSCHSRWSIHSVWRDTPMLLRLQRGEPQLYLNPADAKAIGVRDGAWGEISNDYGKIRMRIKYSTMVRPKVAYYFHAWEPHQFPDHRSYKFLTPGLMNPLHFAGGEGGQLGFFFGHFEPGTHVQDTRVAIAPWRDVEPTPRKETAT
jgi:anaerobic selenocysteine-containing dehydrogenase